MESSARAVNWTFVYHGAPSGNILADEIERDLAPYMGSELCTAVETGYSLAYLYEALGTNHYADRAELVIFNALPGMLTSKMWAHQYMDQPNGPWTNNTGDLNNPFGPSVFTTSNIGVATAFGMEPQYPCCTVNYPQGYPKFLSHSWVAVEKSGIAHALLSPSTVVATISGGQLSVECNTTYPFDNTLTYSIKAETAFDLYLRIPSWSVPELSSIVVNGLSVAIRPHPSTGMHKVPLPPGRSTIIYTIGVGLRTEARANNSVSVYVGNLLYALDVGCRNTSSLPHAFHDVTGPGLDNLPFQQLRDFYLINTAEWNVAIDATTLKYHPLTEHTSVRTPGFSYSSPTNYITVLGCQIAWGLYLDATPDVVPSVRECTGEVRTYRLIPYGSAKIHMSELPTVDLYNVPGPRFKVQLHG